MDKIHHVKMYLLQIRYPYMHRLNTIQSLYHKHFHDSNQWFQKRIHEQLLQHLRYHYPLLLEPICFDGFFVVKSERFFDARTSVASESRSESEHERSEPSDRRSGGVGNSCDEKESERKRTRAKRVE